LQARSLGSLDDFLDASILCRKTVSLDLAEIRAASWVARRLSQFKVGKTDSDELCKEFLEDGVEKIAEDEETARALPDKINTSPGSLDDDEEKAIGVSPDGRFLKFEVTNQMSVLLFQ